MNFIALSESDQCDIDQGITSIGSCWPSLLTNVRRQGGAKSFHDSGQLFVCCFAVFPTVKTREQRRGEIFDALLSAMLLPNIHTCFGRESHALGLLIEGQIKQRLEATINALGSHSSKVGEFLFPGSPHIGSRYCTLEQFLTLYHRSKMNRPGDLAPTFLEPLPLRRQPDPGNVVIGRDVQRGAIVAEGAVGCGHAGREDAEEGAIGGKDQDPAGAGGE